MKKTIFALLTGLALLLGGCCGETAQPPEETPPVQAAACADAAIRLMVKTEDGVQELGLQDYLAGVLLAEMPGDFAPEALKAQAIAARTYALRKADTARHPDAHVCSQSSCCQGYLPLERCDADLAEKLLQAVRQTDGLVLTYEEKLIDATVFSCSGGRTEAAVAVWGGEVPYLQAVDSPGEEAAPVYTELLCWSAGELRQLLTMALPEAVLPEQPTDWFTELVYTPGGGIARLKVGGVTLKGTQLRQILGLRSTRLQLEVSEEEIRITSYGYGHRVGLSQYGAQAMALEGKSCREILLYYYRGTQLHRLQPYEQN